MHQQNLNASFLFIPAERSAEAWGILQNLEVALPSVRVSLIGVILVSASDSKAKRQVQAQGFQSIWTNFKWENDTKSFRHVSSAMVGRGTGIRVTSGVELMSGNQLENQKKGYNIL